MFQTASSAIQQNTTHTYISNDSQSQYLPIDNFLPIDGKSEATRLTKHNDVQRNGSVNIRKDGFLAMNVAFTEDPQQWLVTIYGRPDSILSDTQYKVNITWNHDDIRYSDIDFERKLPILISPASCLNAYINNDIYECNTPSIAIDIYLETLYRYVTCWFGLDPPHFTIATENMGASRVQLLLNKPMECTQKLFDEISKQDNKPSKPLDDSDAYKCNDDYIKAIKTIHRCMEANGVCTSITSLILLPYFGTLQYYRSNAYFTRLSDQISTLVIVLHMSEQNHKNTFVCL